MFVRNINSYERNIISFVRNNISYERNNISFVRNIISFVRNIISYERNNIFFFQCPLWATVCMLPWHRVIKLLSGTNMQYPKQCRSICMVTSESSCDINVKCYVFKRTALMRLLATPCAKPARLARVTRLQF